MSNNHVICQAEAVPVQTVITEAYIEEAESRPEPRSFWSKLFGSAKTPSAPVDQHYREPRDLPSQYQDCNSYDEKVAWINSPRGQSILAERPVLKEYHANGRLLRMMQNKHWDQRLNEWLFISDIARPVPLGLGIPVPKVLKPRVHQELGIFKDNPPITQMFSSHPNFLTPMPFPTSAKYDFLTDGYTIFEGIVPADIVENAVVAISKMVAESEEFKISQAERVKNPHREQDPFFTTGGTNHRDVLALYYCSPICALVESILHNESVGPESMRKGAFRPRVQGAQVAFRFSQTRPRGHMQGVGIWGGRGLGGGGRHGGESQQRIGGRSWHLDGMDKGLYGPFSLLIGVALSDQTVDNCGNLGVHAGSHHTLKDFLKKYAAACDHSTLDANNETAVQERRLYAVSLVQNKPILDEPIQVKLRKGDVVFALHKLAHLGTPNYSEHIRKMVYFRVSHRSLEKLRGPALEDIWLEYEGMGEVLQA